MSPPSLQLQFPKQSSGDAARAAKYCTELWAEKEQCHCERCPSLPDCMEKRVS